MKTNPPASSLSLKSATDIYGRRVITLLRGSRVNHQPRGLLKNAAAARRKGSLKLRVEFAPETFTAFQPVVRVHRPVRRRVTRHLKLQLLNLH